MNTSHFVCKWLLTSRHSMRLLAMSLGTSDAFALISIGRKSIHLTFEWVTVINKKLCLILAWETCTICLLWSFNFSKNYPWFKVWITMSSKRQRRRIPSRSSSQYPGTFHADNSLLFCSMCNLDNVMKPAVIDIKHLEISTQW